MNDPVIAIISDLHFGQHNFNKDVFEEQMKFFELQFFPFLLENNIKNVVCCGDFFHNRNLINWLLFVELKQRFFQWFDNNDVTFHTILGNHDLFYNSTLEVNSLSDSVKEFSNIKVYNKDTTLTIGKYTVGMIPWIINRKTYQFPKKCDMLFCHLEMMNFPMVKGINSKDGFNSSQFANYEYVFSGHYHINYNQDNVYMVGTPYQITWNDFNENKGFYILGKNYELEYIKNESNPKFVKIYYDNDILEQLGLESGKNITTVESIEIAKHNYVRLFVKNVSDQLKLEQLHNSLLIVSKGNYKIDIVYLRDIIEDYDSLDIVNISEESTFDTIKSCIEGMTFDTSIDKSILLKLSKYLYKEASDESISMGEQ